METCSNGYLNHQDMSSDSFNRMISLAGLVCKMEEDHLKISKFAALVVIKPTHHLIYGNMCFDTNKLRIQTHWDGNIKKAAHLKTI